MSPAAKALLEKLKAQNIQCEHQQAVNNGDLISVAFAGSKPDVNYEILIVIDSSQTSVILRCFDILPVEKSKKKAALRVLNERNMNCQWIKFFLDEENKVAAGVDAIVKPETAGDITYALLVRLLQIVDGSYELIEEGVK